MRRIARVVFALCLSLQAFGAGKQAEWKPLDVPKEIKTKQAIDSTPEGWAVSKETQPNLLAMVTISQGTASSEDSLVYDEETRQKDKLILTWNFDPTLKDPLYITCSYASTSVAINKRLPEGIQALRITYDETIKTEGLPTVQKIEYR